MKRLNHIVINPEYEYMREWIANLPNVFETTGKIIYDDRNQIRLMQYEDMQICVKRYCVPSVINRLAYTYVRKPKAERAFNNALELTKRDIPTPTPIAYIIQYQHGIISQSYLITTQSNLKRNFYEFRDGITDGKEDIIKSLARFTASMHEKGVYHLDFSPGNILFDNIDGLWHFELIDINRMQFRNVSAKKGCSQFERLWGKQVFFEIIAEEYSIARNIEYNTCLQNILKARHKFWSCRSTEHFTTDDTFSVGIIISTYNNPLWLEKVLWGLMYQTHQANEIIIADDGSDNETKLLIEKYAGTLPLKYVWHEDKGFRKTTILNKAVLQSASDYLIFLDHDLIPRKDFVSTHYRNAQKGGFLSGGAIMIPQQLSYDITRSDVENGNIFSIKWLIQHGVKWSHKLLKLCSSKIFASIMNHLTPTKATWNGGNASTWREYIINANGFDTRMRYGAEDREFGTRLENAGIRGKQIRYSIPLIHLWHQRPYKNKDDWNKNMLIWQQTKKQKLTRTQFGIEQL